MRESLEHLVVPRWSLDRSPRVFVYTARSRFADIVHRVVRYRRIVLISHRNSIGEESRAGQRARTPEHDKVCVAPSKANNTGAPCSEGRLKSRDG